MALLAYLGHLQQHVAAAQQRAHGQGAEVEAAHDEVLAEVAVDHVRALRAEGLYLVGGEQAHLAVPVPGVGVVLNAPVGDEFAHPDVALLYALFLAYTYGKYGSHIFSLQSVTSGASRS